TADIDAPRKPATRFARAASLVRRDRATLQIRPWRRLVSCSWTRIRRWRGIFAAPSRGTGTSSGSSARRRTPRKPSAGGGGGRGGGGAAGGGGAERVVGGRGGGGAAPLTPAPPGGGPALPIVALTEPGGRSQASQARAAGAWDYLEPPGDLASERVLSVIANALDRRR